MPKFVVNLLDCISNVTKKQYVARDEIHLEYRNLVEDPPRRLSIHIRLAVAEAWRTGQQPLPDGVFQRSIRRESAGQWSDISDLSLQEGMPVEID